MSASQYLHNAMTAATKDTLTELGVCSHSGMVIVWADY